MRHLLLGSVLAVFGCDAREPAGAGSPVRSNRPPEEPLGAVALPDVDSCVKDCLRENPPGSEEAAECRKSCKARCEARCAELANDLSARCNDDCEHQERLAP